MDMGKRPMTTSNTLVVNPTRSTPHNERLHPIQNELIPMLTGHKSPIGAYKKRAN
jgi:hypothetical protein